MSIMSASFKAGTAWLLAAAALLWLAVPSSASAVVYSFGLHPDKERLVFRFDGPVPSHELTRTGVTELFLGLPKGYALDLTDADTFGLRNARLVDSVRPTPGGVAIGLKDPAFGYVSFSLDDQHKIVVDVFRDPLGARWKPRPGSAAPKAAEAAPDTGPLPAPAPSATTPVPAVPDAAEAAQPDTQPQSLAARSEAGMDKAAPSPPPASDSLPSYVFRGQVRQVGPNEAQTATRQAVAPPPPPPAPETAQPAAVEKSAPGPSVGAEASPRPSMDAAGEEAPLAVRIGRPASERPAPTMRGQVDLNPPAGEFRGLAVPPSQAKPLKPEQAGSFEQAVQGVVGQDKALDTAMQGAPSAEPPAPGPLDAASGPAPSPLDSAMNEAAGPGPDNATMAGGGDQGPLPPPGASDEVMRQKFEDVLKAAQTAIVGGDYKTGLQQLDLMLSDDRLPKDMREEALYTRADTLYSRYRDSLRDHYDEINGAYEQAMNFNLDSERVPSALLRRGMLNLNVDNLPEAKAYFSLLRKKYPNDLNVPLTYFYWGEYYYNKGLYEQAAQQYEHLVQVFPDSKFVREAAVKLALSLRKLGYDENAFQIVDFIEKRWPRFYIEYPPLLRLQGDTAFAAGDMKKAKDDYWTYYNIDPKGDDADMVLARLGDIYSKAGQDKAAREVYSKAVADFPDREGGLISDMRLAEKGVQDDPSISKMFSIFDQPYSRKPAEIYTRIVKDFPKSGLAPLAQIKLAIWHLWNKKYMKSLDAVEGFLKKYPGSELASRAEDVGLEAFSRMVEQVMADDNYPRVMALWKDNPFVRKNWQRLDPPTRLRVAQAFLKRGDPTQAMDLVAGLLRGDQVPGVSQGALSLALTLLVDQQSWQRVLDLARLKDEWKLDPPHVRQLNYALALAEENLGHADKARKMWLALGNDLNLPSQQRAYALYFLAENAREKRQLRDAFDYASDAYSLLLETKSNDTDKIKDVLRILIDVTESSGRYRDALRFGLDYQKYLSPDDPNAPAFNYRLANLYRRAGEVKKWREMLEALSRSKPDSLYGRMAASDLQSFSLEQAAREYIPSP